MTRRIALLTLLAALSCSAVFSQSADHSANGLALTGVFTPARAMKLIYGSYDSSQAISHWTPKSTNSYPRGWPDTVDVRVLLDVPFVESGLSNRLFVTSAIPKEGFQGEFSCHSCGVLLGFALFSKTSHAWRVDASDLQFGEYGEFGNPPSISLQPVGSDRYGLLIPSSFGSGGVLTDSITLIVPKDGKFLKALNRQIANSWYEDGCSGQVKPTMIDYCVAYDGDFDFVPDSHSDYYDLVLMKRIYRSLSKKNPLGTTSTRYRFDGSKYVPVETPPNKSARSPN